MGDGFHLQEPISRIVKRLRSIRLSQYAIALLAVVAAAILRAVGEPVLHNRSPYEIFLIAVVVVGLTCDLVPTLVAIAFGGTAADFLFSEPRLSLHQHPTGWWMLAAFFASSGAITFATQTHRRSARRLRSTLSEIAQAQDALRQQAVLLDLSGDAVFVRDLDGAITYWNRGAEALYGYSAQQAMGQVSYELLKTTFPCPLPEFQERLLHEQMLCCDLIQTARDGRVMVAESRLQIIRSRGGRLLVLESCRDISQRRRDEETLRRAEKLVAAAHMASTLAHEINNPLAAAINVTYLVRTDPDLPQNLRHQAALLDAELTRVSHIVRETLSLYREDTRPCSSFRPREVVEDVLRSLVGVLHGITVEARYGIDGAVEMNRPEFYQLLSNLLRNAAEASAGRGSIRVHVFASRDWRRPERQGMRIVVADSGCGISPEDRPHLIEPFFTTKQQKGAGLGLSVVQWISAKYDGALRIRSSTRPGRSGTSVSVFLAVTLGVRPQPVRIARRSQAS